MLIICLMAIIEGVQALDYDYGKAKTFKHPLREVSIIVTPEGYYPRRVSLFEGERIRFFITSITDQSSCFMLPQKNIFIPANKGEVSEVEVLFKSHGQFQFHCPTGKIKGNITVLAKETEEQKIQRKIASQRNKRVKIWMPRED